MSAKTARRVSSLLLMLLAACHSWVAAAAPPDQQETDKIVADVRNAMVKGPATVELRDQASIKLPERFGFIPQKEAAAFMKLMGNRTSEEFMGLIMPLTAQDSGQWFVSLNYDPAGYIKDDDAKHWDADKLLQNIKDGTEAGNADRQRAGIPALVVTRWIQPPGYESDSHRLVWSVEARRKDGGDPDPTINYNTYALGREGYISLNLVTSESRIAGDKAEAGQLLSAVDFKSGKRYGDFNSSTDKVAAYGLAALVAGVAAKKLGLLALLGAGILKFAKVIIIAVAAFGAGVVRWFKARVGRRDSAA
jgi:uncharacterized membrane-anchored protein